MKAVLEFIVNMLPVISKKEHRKTIHAKDTIIRKLAAQLAKCSKK